ncbi:hypothetical protein EI94DRAFT_1811828 [Lactarius quietus]|nr:hypothetical protein EI94DRAFT_1811828 [Lactarius quietus]
MPSTASSAHASAPRATPVPTAATCGLKQRTDVSRPMASATPGPMSSSAPIATAQLVQQPAPYDFLCSTSLHLSAWPAIAPPVCTNMEVDEDRKPPVADDVGPESEEEDGEMEDGSREELPVPSSTSAPWLQIRIPIHLPQMPAVSPEVAVVLDAHTDVLHGVLNDMHRLREQMNKGMNMELDVFHVWNLDM